MKPYDVIPTERPSAKDGRLRPYGLRRCSGPELPETQVILPEHTGKSSARDRKDPVPDTKLILCNFATLLCTSPTFVYTSQT